MNKTVKAVIIGLLLVVASSAFGKIGETPQVVLNRSYRDNDIVSTQQINDRGLYAILNRFKDGNRVEHVFGQNGREIAMYTVASTFFKAQDVVDIQRLYRGQWQAKGVTDGLYLWMNFSAGVCMSAKRHSDYDYLVLFDMNRGAEVKALTNAGRMPALFQPQAQPQPQPQTVAPGPQEENDCAVIATEKFAVLKKAGVWVGMARFNENTLAPIGHAIVIWQPSDTSNVFIYLGKNMGTIEVGTRSHELGDIFAALNRALGGLYNFQYTRWTAI